MSSFAISGYYFFMESSEIKQIYTSNIRKYRKLNGMTQMQLAEAADLSVGFLCDLESGKKYGTLETMVKLSNALKIMPYQLLLPEESNNQSTHFYEDLSELSKNVKLAIDKEIDLIKKQYTS